MAMLPVRTDQQVKDSQDMPAVFHHAGKNVSKLGFAFGVLVPFGQNRRGNFNVAAQLFRGVSAQEQAIKESRFALREVEIRNEFGRH